MQVFPLVVNELRALFKDGATPSALIRQIAERHAGEPQLDGLVRLYFREAFHVPMIHVGPEQVRHVAAGGSLPTLNATVLPRMIQSRTVWDTAGGACWLDAVPISPTLAEPSAIPELADSWEKLDDAAKQFVQRLLDSARALHDNVNVLAALAEQLQSRTEEAGIRLRRA